MNDFATLFTDDEPSLLAFRWRLAEAIAWAGHYSLPKPERITWMRQPENVPDLSWSYHALRSPLREAIHGIDLEQIQLSTLPTDESEDRRLVEAVVRARADVLRAENWYPLAAASHLNGGTLIAYYPMVGFDDGTPAFASDGFFDVADAPPFETWLGLASGDSGRQYSPSGNWREGALQQHEQWSGTYTDDYLIAYVPPDLIDLVSAGIKVNFIDGINWLHNLNTSFTRLLFAANIITPAWSAPESPRA